MTKDHSNIPALVTLDMEAAFPSVDRRYLLRALRHVGVPAPAVRLARALYHDNDLAVRVASGEHTLCRATSGVAQGCPFSGLAFVIAADGLVRAMHRGLTHHRAGLLRATADDIGIVLRRLRDLRLLPALMAAERAVGLRLGPGKCRVVPLCGPDGPGEPSQALVDDTRAVLATVHPPWVAFKVAGHATYLGFDLGPCGGGSSWGAPCSKYATRVREIVARAPPAGAAARLYNVLAVSALSYVGSLARPPAHFRRTERDAQARVLRLPGTPFPYEGLVELAREWGWPAFRHIRAMSAHVRASPLAHAPDDREVGCAHASRGA
mmetsp:Transcript_38328/g.110596  ORF Transcript_38328/g.110596 Transcript_38328/m.110596 type:complete len:322 (+) Transcript_38328:323-1288(+)